MLHAFPEFLHAPHTKRHKGFYTTIETCTTFSRAPGGPTSNSFLLQPRGSTSTATGKKRCLWDHGFPGKRLTRLCRTTYSAVPVTSLFFLMDL